MSLDFFKWCENVVVCSALGTLDCTATTTRNTARHAVSDFSWRGEMAPKTNHEKQIARQVRKFVGVFKRKYPKAPLKTVFSPDLAHFSMKISDFYNYFRNFKVKILIYEILGGGGELSPLPETAWLNNCTISIRCCDGKSTRSISGVTSYLLGTFTYLT